MKSIRKRGRWKTIFLAAAVILILSAPSNSIASIEKVDGGIKFTYYDPDAGRVTLAGTMNGWNVDATLMTRDKDGYWSVVVPLSQGEYEYKFVVDGAWITDSENPSTKADPYGGSNSLVEIDAGGDIVLRADIVPTSNIPLNTQIRIGGRYLSRTLTERNVEEDTRWRMQRPEQNLDLDFTVSISDLVQGYFRLRVDSENDLVQPNNVAAYLDDAHVTINPSVFDLTAYYSEEILRSGDPLLFFGDVDLPGTIFDDHLKQGKGTSGFVLTTSRYGVDFESFAANVHDYDTDNNPDLFDNTGTDLISIRGSKRHRGVTAGANFFMIRNIWWLDFVDRVGSYPANTGIPILDQYLDSSRDNSDWFEFDDSNWYAGGDITLHLYEDRLLPQLEYLQGKDTQTFVTSNKSGINDDNGPIDVPIMDRDMRIYHGSVRSTIIENFNMNIEHTRTEQSGGNPNESMLIPIFLPETEANKHIFFTIDGDPATYTEDYSELEIDWNVEGYSAILWFQRSLGEFDGPGGGYKEWYYLFSVAPYLKFSPVEKLALELEGQFKHMDGSSSSPFYGISLIESITRASYNLTEKLSAIMDIRVARYTVSRGTPEEENHTYTAPFVGLQYKPMRKVDVVLAYGVDPLDFNIDYSGRQIGRYNFRRDYLWANPGASITDAEKELADRKVITLRAIFNF